MCSILGQAPTCEAGEIAVHVVGVFVLDALFPLCAASNGGGMQTGHAAKQALGWVSPHCAELHCRIKRLCCDYGSRLTKKICQLLHHLCVIKEYLGVVLRRDRKRAQMGSLGLLGNNERINKDKAGDRQGKINKAT